MDISRITFPTSVMVTDQEIDTSFLAESQQNFYKELFLEITNRYISIQAPRVIIGLAGPTGSGKSVLTSLFQEFARQIDVPFNIQTLSIDAFHYPNEYLQSHTNSEGKILKEVKGRFDTYDVEKFITCLIAFKADEDIALPEYSRKIHNPVESVYAITERNTLLIVEGLWLLYKGNRWEQVLPLLDYKIFINADKEKVKEMAVVRHERGGRTKEDANDYYDSVDAINFDLVNPTKIRADKIIPSYHEI